MSLLKPACLRNKGLAFSSLGYIVPCCWYNLLTDENKKDLNKFGLLDEKFHLNNLKSSDDIINIFKSNEWINFVEMLKHENDIDKIPKMCFKMCSKNRINDAKEKITLIPK